MRVYVSVLRTMLVTIWLVLRLTFDPNPGSGMSPEVRRRKEQRLDLLLEQAASYGLDVPAHIASEINDLRDELETVDLLANGKLDRMTREAANKYDPRHLILQVRTDLSRRIRSLENGVNAILETNRADAEQRHLDRSRGSFIVGILAALMFLVLILVVILLIVGLR